MFKIEKGIPIPKRTRRSAEDVVGRYGLLEMNVGDSITVPCDKPEAERNRLNVTLAAIEREKNVCVRITTRYSDGVLQIWRIA